MSDHPTYVQDAPAPPPEPGPPPKHRGLSGGSWLSLLLATACGFLLGALVITTVGGTDPAVRTETRRVTVTGPVANGGTVITSTIVPQLVGEPLDVAKERAARSKFALTVDSGEGIFGVIRDSNWEVTAQRPIPGELLEQGSTLHVDIKKR